MSISFPIVVVFSSISLRIWSIFTVVVLMSYSANSANFSLCLDLFLLTGFSLAYVVIFFCFECLVIFKLDFGYCDFNVVSARFCYIILYNVKLCSRM